MSRILLVRHGESEWNASGRWQGQANPPLTDHGLHQARQAARAIGTVDAIVSSSLDRAHTTAGVISDHLGVGPVRLDDRLMERDAGEWSGLTRSEIMEAWPGYLEDTTSGNPIRKRPPGWESDQSLLDRAIDALRALDDLLGGGDAVAVTHGGVMYAIEAHLGAPAQYIPNLGARWVTLDRGRLTIGDRIALLDDGSQRQADRTAI